MMFFKEYLRPAQDRLGSLLGRLGEHLHLLDQVRLERDDRQQHAELMHQAEQQQASHAQARAVPHLVEQQLLLALGALKLRLGRGQRAFDSVELCAQRGEVVVVKRVWVVAPTSRKTAHALA